MKRSDIGFYFPGWTRKSLTFTIDDGNLKFDEIFLDILRPANIKGTFNLCDPNRTTPEEYREFYKGYEIANHCKLHPMCLNDNVKPIVSDEPFDKMGGEDFTEENPVVYKTENEGVYMHHPIPQRIRPDGWFKVVDGDTYLRLAGESLVALQNIFGENEVKGFVWPFREQSNERVIEALKTSYNSIRKTGALLDSTGFALPGDRYHWSYNATCNNLLSLMETYEKYPDDGELKFFCFGVHSYDFERDQKWDDLRLFAEIYGNRPSDFWYASVSEIFEYEDAANSIDIACNCVENRSDVTLYLEISGKKIVLAPGEAYSAD